MAGGAVFYFDLCLILFERMVPLDLILFHVDEQMESLPSINEVATENYSVNMAGGVNVWLLSSSLFIILLGGWSDWTFYFVQMNKPPGDMWRRCQPCLYHRFRHFALPQDVWILCPFWVWTDEEVRQATNHFAALRALSDSFERGWVSWLRNSGSEPELQSSSHSFTSAGWEEEW